MALPWEVPMPMSGTARTRPRLPWETPTPDVPELTGAQPFPVPEADEGFLSKLGYVLDTPGAYTRGFLAGDPGERVSGQDMLENWGLFDEGPDEGLFSIKGGAGLLSELALDPMNLFFGAGALTKAGKAAKGVATGLKEASRLGRVMQGAEMAGDAARIAEASRMSGMADILALPSKVTPELEALRSPITGQLPSGLGAATALDSPAAQLGRQAMAPGPKRALLGIGGEVSPIPFLPGFNVPEKVLIEGAPVVDAVGGALKAIPGVKGLSQLFEQSPLEKLARDEQVVSKGVKAEREYMFRQMNDALAKGEFDKADELERQLFPEAMPAPPDPLADALAAKKAGDQDAWIDAQGRISDQAMDEIGAPSIDEMLGMSARDPVLPRPPIKPDTGPVPELFGPIASDVAGAKVASKVAKATKGKHASYVDAYRSVETGLSKSADTASQRAILDAIESGVDPEEAFGALDPVREVFKKWGDAEEQMAGLVQRSGAYVPHMTTDAGKGFFQSLDGVREFERRVVEAGGKVLDGGVARQLENMDPKLRATLEKRGTLGQYLEETMVGAHNKRKYDLPITKLNDIAASMGSKAPIFEQDVRKILERRGMQHFRVKGVHDFVQGIQQSPEFTAMGIKPLTGEAAQAAIKEGRPPLEFPDRKTADMVTNAYRQLNDPVKANELLDFWDNATTMFKSYVTRPFPAYHFRNHLSNRMQSWFEGIPFVGDHFKAANKIAAGEDVAVNIGGKTMGRDELMQEYLRNGGQGGGFYEDLAKESAAGLNRPKAFQGDWNPLNPDNRFIQGMEKASATVAGAPGRLASGAKLEKMDGQAIELADRLGHYIYKRQQGFAPKAAMESTNKALFDYSKAGYTAFENDYLRRGVLFYTYTRNVVPFMLEKALEKPGAISGISRLANQPGKPEHLPSWASEGLPLPIGQDAEGNSMLAYGLGTPLEGAVEPFAGFSDGVGRGLEKLLTQLNPAIKMPLEVATGKDFFLGKEVEDLRKAPNYADELPDFLKDTLGVKAIPTKAGGVRQEMDPWTAYGLRNNPLSRFGTTASKVFDDRKGAGETLANILTGARVVSIDEEKEAQYAVRQAIIDRLKELEREGKAKSFDTFGYGAGEKDPEVQQLLKMLRGN